MCLVLLVVGLLLLQKPYVSLMVNGKVVATAKRPFIQPIRDGATDVYVGKEKIFSLWQDFFDFPCFIYPFADGKRFLCDYDDDTSLLDFVVDFRDSATNEPRSSGWPPNDNVMGNYVRTYMASRMTNVVLNTKGIVRLPTYAELHEVSGYLTGTNQAQIKAGYFNFFGSKESLLLDLATNRQSVWPLAK
jgi:hypothetical protein